MKKLIVALSLVIGGIVGLNAQNYETGIGLRLGYPYGINIKHFVSKTTALDATLISSGEYLGLVALIDWHENFEGYSQWKWYWGPGAHLKFNFVPDVNGNTVLLGFDGVLGAEYTFKNDPISISFDWVPSLNIVEHFGMDLINAGISVRYVF